MAQLRTSSHGFKIETGRHGNNRGNIINRVCNIEDETHVLQLCPLYEELRKKLKDSTTMALYNDQKLLFQKCPEIREFSRFLILVNEKRFPKKTPSTKNRYTETNYAVFSDNTVILIE